MQGRYSGWVYVHATHTELVKDRRGFLGDMGHPSCSVHLANGQTRFASKFCSFTKRVEGLGGGGGG